jgi:plasmid stabilization system protein ParE
VTRRLSLRPEALTEIHEALTWYSLRGLDLDAAFLDELVRVLEVIRTSPEQYPQAGGDLRKAVMRRFPYLVLYRVRDDEVVVTSCIHGRRNPKRWRTP